MSLLKNEFVVLKELRLNPCSSQRAIAERSGLALGTVNAASKALSRGGLIDGGRITPKGAEALEPYKVANAVVMAAGLSSRFAPISYEKPKGLLKVRGEVLIERQIEQLKEAGIERICVVVGYKKEYFFYLEEKYGVEIAVNREFASRNNHSTLMCVRERLGNTYICSSDDYFTENPFEPYEWKAYYAAEYCEGATQEWCIRAGAKDRIESVSPRGGSDSWYMIGHAYFDQAFSNAYVRILENEYELPETADKLWEQLYVDHIHELDMEIRRFGPGVIHEFDSLDDLREFDPRFLENVDSEIFDNICAVLGCEKGEIHDVYPLKEGLTNLSCHFATDEGEYVYRHPGVGTELMIDRHAEKAAQEFAKAAGLDDTFVYEDPRSGWKISRFIRNARQLDPHDGAHVSRAMGMIARLHSSDVRVERTFDYLTESKKYEAELLRKGPIDVPGYREMADDAARLKAFANGDDTRSCLTHNDFFHLNLLFDECDTLHLIDWEYAGMSDYASDFGTFVVTSELSTDEALNALACYFDRKPTFEETRHNFAYVALAGWCWYVWALLKESEGDYVGEWLYVYYNYAKKYLSKTLAWYDEGFLAKDVTA